MIAMVLTLLAQGQTSGAQGATAGAATSWNHALVRHESYNDFQYGSGFRCEFVADAPLRMWARNVSSFPSEAERAIEARFGTQEQAQMHGMPEGWARFEAQPIDFKTTFNELVVSWNAKMPASGSIAVEVSVRAKEGGAWSPWLCVGEWGPVNASFKGVTEFEGGKVVLDRFVSDREHDRAKYRLTAMGDEKLISIDIFRVALCASHRTASEPAMSLSETHAIARIAVPFRSQTAEKAEIAGKLGLATSVGMAMAFRGVDKPTSEVAERMFDKAHDSYSNWTRAAQGAFTFGVPSYLARFSEWGDVEKLVGGGQPLVIEVGDKTAARTLVLCGFDKNGGGLLLDPSAADATKGQIAMRRDQLDDAWMAHGGTALVLLAKEK
jgi:hypothetical protein